MANKKHKRYDNALREIAEKFKERQEQIKHDAEAMAALHKANRKWKQAKKDALSKYAFDKELSARVRARHETHEEDIYGSLGSSRKQPEPVVYRNRITITQTPPKEKNPIKRMANRIKNTKLGQAITKRKNQSKNGPTFYL